MRITRKQSGFTLVEIMIVVAIIGLLAAIAIPSLLRARMSANEGAIKYDLRTFSSANESYRAAQASPTYASAVSDLTGASPAYLDSSWSNGGTRHGFTTTYATGSSSTYTMLAANIANQSENDYCVDQSGVIRVGLSGVAGGGSACSGGSVLGA